MFPWENFAHVFVLQGRKNFSVLTDHIGHRRVGACRQARNRDFHDFLWSGDDQHAIFNGDFFFGLKTLVRSDAHAELPGCIRDLALEEVCLDFGFFPIRKKGRRDPPGSKHSAFFQAFLPAGYLLFVEGQKRNARRVGHGNFRRVGIRIKILRGGRGLDLEFQRVFRVGSEVVGNLREDLLCRQQRKNLGLRKDLLPAFVEDFRRDARRFPGRCEFESAGFDLALIVGSFFRRCHDPLVFADRDGEIEFAPWQIAERLELHRRRIRRDRGRGDLMGTGYQADEGQGKLQNRIEVDRPNVPVLCGLKPEFAELHPHFICPPFAIRRGADFPWADKGSELALDALTKNIPGGIRDQIEVAGLRAVGRTELHFHVVVLE